MVTVDRQDLSNKEQKLGKAYGTEYAVKKDSKAKSAGDFLIFKGLKLYKINM